jgi:hypothetical protein
LIRQIGLQVSSLTSSGEFKNRDNYNIWGFLLQMQTI